VILKSRKKPGRVEKGESERVLSLRRGKEKGFTSRTLSWGVLVRPKGGQV